MAKTGSELHRSRMQPEQLGFGGTSNFRGTGKWRLQSTPSKALTASNTMLLREEASVDPKRGWWINAGDAAVREVRGKKEEKKRRRRRERGRPAAHGRRQQRRAAQAGKTRRKAAAAIR